MAVAVGVPADHQLDLGMVGRLGVVDPLGGLLRRAGVWVAKHDHAEQPRLVGRERRRVGTARHLDRALGSREYPEAQVAGDRGDARDCRLMISGCGQ